MKFYLDDCLVAKTLIQLLRKGGFIVVLPEEVGLQGRSDQEHFDYVRREGCVLITSNSSDFLELHQKNPQHSGILAVYQDNNPKKDLSFQEMVRVIQKILKKKIPFQNQFIVLNHWR